MKILKNSKLFILLMFLLCFSVFMALTSIFPFTSSEFETFIVKTKSFNLTSLETIRYGLGSFRGDETVYVSIVKFPMTILNFSILTYNGLEYSDYSANDIEYSFNTTANYYEALFFSQSEELIEIHFEVSVKNNNISFPFLSINNFAKGLFLLSIFSLFFIIVNSFFNSSSDNVTIENMDPPLSHRNKRIVLFLLLLSLIFWISLIITNTNSHASFENWYTDHARHPYSSSLFTKFGLSIFNTPLGDLASIDSSYYKFVTWPQMPHLYPAGSFLLFLPFAFLLQNAANQILVYKLEIFVFLIFSHSSLYFFLKKFWNKNSFLLLRLIGIYSIYIPLIVYSANGMFDSVPFFFSLIALNMFLSKRYDNFLFFIAISSIFKYQPLLFLFPLIIIALLNLSKKNSITKILKNRKVTVSIFLMATSFFTAFLSLPFLMESNNLSIMNGLTAFNLHSQIPWLFQSLAVLLTLTITLFFSLYMLGKNPIISLLSLFILLPSFFLQYFQIWYLPFLFLYSLIPQKKRDVELTLIWLFFMMGMLSFGALSFNPLNVINGWSQILGL